MIHSLIFYTKVAFYLCLTAVSLLLVKTSIKKTSISILFIFLIVIIGVRSTQPTVPKIVQPGTMSQAEAQQKLALYIQVLKLQPTHWASLYNTSVLLKELSTTDTLPLKAAMQKINPK
jgi:hypothetical protein